MAIKQIIADENDIGEALKAYFQMDDAKIEIQGSVRGGELVLTAVISSEVENQDERV